MCYQNFCHIHDLIWGGDKLWFVQNNQVMYYEQKNGDQSFLLNTDDVMGGVPTTCKGAYCYIHDLVVGGGKLWFVKNNEIMHHAENMVEHSYVLNTNEALPTVCLDMELCHIRNLVWGGGKLWFVKNNKVMYHDPAMGDQSSVLNTDGTSQNCQYHCSMRDLVWGGDTIWFVNNGSLMYHYDTLGDQSLRLDTGTEPGITSSCLGDFCQVHELEYAGKNRLKGRNPNSTLYIGLVCLAVGVLCLLCGLGLYCFYKTCQAPIKRATAFMQGREASIGEPYEDAEELVDEDNE
jgi:hypothetical protein